MTANLQLVPFVQGDILAINDGKAIHIVMPSVVADMGLDWESQRQRIERHPLMSETTCVMQVVTATGAKPTTVMTLEGFHTFLVTLHPDRITDQEVRERVLVYQRRAFRAVFEHFHGRSPALATPKMRSIPDLLRVAAALKVETNRSVRALLWEEMDAITDSRGLPRCGRAIGYDEPDYSELLGEFWSAIAALDELEIKTNFSRRNDVIALHLPTIRQHLSEIGSPVTITREMKDALRASERPLFIADKGVNCYDSVNRHCWVFSVLPQLPLNETQ